jgi:hypothetical protein
MFHDTNPFGLESGPESLPMISLLRSGGSSWSKAAQG